VRAAAPDRYRPARSTRVAACAQQRRPTLLGPDVAGAAHYNAAQMHPTCTRRRQFRDSDTNASPKRYLGLELATRGRSAGRQRTGRDTLFR
jgi:hypothetical protein